MEKRTLASTAYLLQHNLPFLNPVNAAMQSLFCLLGGNGMAGLTGFLLFAKGRLLRKSEAEGLAKGLKSGGPTITDRHNPCGPPLSPQASPTAGCSSLLLTSGDM